MLMNLQSCFALIFDFIIWSCIYFALFKKKKLFDLFKEEGCIIVAKGNQIFFWSVLQDSFQESMAWWRQVWAVTTVSGSLRTPWWTMTMKFGSRLSRLNQSSSPYRADANHPSSHVKTANCFTSILQ